MRRLGIAVVLVAAFGANAHAGGTEDLAAARQLKEQLDFDGALAAVRHGIGAGDNDLFELRELYQLAGELAAGLDRNDEAFDWFRHVLALEPTVTLPEGTSPKVAAPFKRAVEWVTTQGALTVTGEQKPGVFVVTIGNDPLRMIAGARVTVSDSNGNATTQQRPATAEIRVSTPTGTQSVTVALVDEHGNLLRSLDSFPSSQEVHENVREGPPLYARWQVWGAIGVIGAVIGVYGGIRLSETQDEWDRLRAEDGQHDYSELAAVEQHGRSLARTANIGIGIATIGGALAAVCAWRQWRHGHHAKPAEVVDDGPTIELLSGGLSLGYAGHF